MSEVITNNLDLWTSALLTKSSAGRGSNGKQEAYGIKKLRELILGTALRGLFDKENESLPEAIDKDISNARNAYYKSIGKRPKEIDYGPPLLNEFKLPSGWMWKRVGELCDLQTGATPNTHKPEYFGGDIRWLVSGDINQGIIEECDGRISEQGLANSNCKVLPPKTVLIALNGQGKTRASVALLNVPAACNQSLVGMIPFDAIILDPLFLLLSLKYRYYEIRDITGQNQRRGLNMGLVAELSVPLPPLAEQHRIVAKVDELMALCDQLEQQQTHSLEAHQTLVETLLGTLTHVASPQELTEAWTRIANNFDTLFTAEHSIDQLKQTILQLAVMGKLVPQDPNDEPAGVLLERVATEKFRLFKEGEIGRSKVSHNIESSELPYEIAANWSWARLGDLCGLENGDRSKNYPNKSLLVEEGIPFINAGHLEDSRINMVEMNYISEERFNLLRSGKVREGDILYCLRGSLGKSAIVHDIGRGAIASSLVIVRALAPILNRYVLNYFQSPLALETMRRYDNGTAQPNLSATDLAKFVVPVPPAAEQHRIVAKVDELMALCDALKARIKDAQTTQIHLADAIVEQAVA